MKPPKDVVVAGHPLDEEEAVGDLTSGFVKTLTTKLLSATSMETKDTVQLTARCLERL